MSKFCHLEKVPQFLFSHARKVSLSKEHCSCAFLFGSLFYVVDAYHLKFNFCICIVCILRAGRGPWCWQLTVVFEKDLTRIRLPLRWCVSVQLKSLFKTIMSWLWPCSILSNMTSARCYHPPCILSRPNCTPEASYLIHSWFHLGVC